MKIGVDAHVLAGKFQGSRTYLLNLYQEVLKQSDPEDYVFFGHWENEASPPYSSQSKYVNFKSGSKVKRLTYQSLPLLKDHNIDLYHTQYISPLMMPCDTICTIHDILFETHPQYFSKQEVIRNKILVRFSAQRAKQVHTVSQYSKSKIVELYGIPEHKVKVVPNGVDLTRFTSEGKNESAGLIEQKYGVRDYILTVGRIEPRKNHIALLEAYKILMEKNIKVGPLVIVGKPDFGFQDFFNRIDELQLKPYVHIIESVDDRMLPHIYRAASVFVYPTFAEGFGIPPIEAMASGVPVVSSNTTAIPDVIGDAGIMVDPESYSEIATSIATITKNSELKERLIKKGLTQAEKWTWEAAAKHFIQSVKDLTTKTVEIGR
ncbi:glycosyltransferase family 4 protein [Paenibacillus sp. B01]|uniref:glycosyltransferase family 4 protein n=1 Tax=Paenibacillus sp. B01 TaxID=2660554 RepID=UPI00129B802E|nr:glycosyltransferase family 1 protein [Paenibacillus sp. B01]QGG55271.1 glycosyltransferase [Paenibacillus sp. B01]